MSKIQAYNPGTFCWVDLGTVDVEAAKTFYGGLFGWTFNPAEEGGQYHIASKNGEQASGIYQIGDDLKGMARGWTSYVSVINASDLAGTVESLGGKVVVAPRDVMGQGRMALFQDPTGAPVAIWEPRAHKGAGIVNEPGFMCWQELLAQDAASAVKFYTSLFGWTTQVQPMGPVQYTSFICASRPIAGLMKIDPSWGRMPPAWMVYFAVEDCDQSVAKVAELGGRIVTPPMDVPNVGRFATIQDSQGVMSSIIKLVQQ